MTQEELAEAISISTTHMNHIENANTKLSLPVLIDIAQALEVKTDTLIFGMERGTREISIQDVAEVLESCNAVESRITADIVIALKRAFDAYNYQDSTST